MLSEQFLIEVILKADEIEDNSVYPFSLNAFRHLSRLKLHPKVTFFVGENGSGKSTLLEAIAVANGFNPEGGTKNFGFSTRESHSILDKYIRCSRGIKKPRDGYFLRAETFYNVAGEIENLDSEFSFGPPIINSYGGEIIARTIPRRVFSCSVNESIFQRLLIYIGRTRGCFVTLETNVNDLQNE